MDDSVLEPLEQYNNKFKDLHNQNTIIYFDNLVKKSGINIEENKLTIKKYKESLAKAEDKRSDLSKIRVFRTVLLLISIVLFIFAFYLFFERSFLGLGQMPSILIGIGLIVISILILTIPFKKMGKRIKELKNQENKFMIEAENFKKQAYAQMEPLNRLYDWNIASELLEKTVPLIQMDQFFDTKKFEYLQEKYGFMDNNDNACSTNYVQSGSIMGNPFLIINTFNQIMVNHTYQGSIVIHWTERVSDGKGGTRTVHRSQTLIATVTKPKPSYFYDTILVYGNDAAPNLSFFRDPSGTKGEDEKGIDKLIKKGEKNLEKQSEEAINEGKHFMLMGNTEFDVLFGAHDRDNEVEFRLLFTPLGQQNMIKLIRSQEPFGDDFKFKKIKNLNYIMSDHSQRFNYHCEPSIFQNFDYEAARKFFIDYNNDYFKGLYFDLAPLLAIPLYQQTKPKEYIYRNTIKSNITSYEHESMANAFKNYNFKHPEAVTEQILKTSFINKNGDVDHVRVRSNAFKAVPQVEFVTKMGGDGRIHTIPVHWYLYEPVYKDTEMEVSNMNINRNYFQELNQNSDFKNCLAELGTNGIIYERGLVSMLVNKELVQSDIEKLKKFMEKDGK